MSTIKESIYETVNLMSHDQEPEQMQANAMIQSLQKEISDLKDIVAQLKPQSHRKPCKYCWTHGCAKSGVDCRAKVDGHRDDATMENKMAVALQKIVKLNDKWKVVLILLKVIFIKNLLRPIKIIIFTYFP